jgi:hypothetical protein
MTSARLSAACDTLSVTNEGQPCRMRQPPRYTWGGSLPEHVVGWEGLIGPGREHEHARSTVATSRGGLLEEGRGLTSLTRQ